MATKKKAPPEPKKMTTEELLAFCEEHDLEIDSVLDDMVHDVFSERASAVNNSGYDVQLKFLGSVGYSKRDIESALS